MAWHGHNPPIAHCFVAAIFTRAGLAQKRYERSKLRSSNADGPHETGPTHSE